MTTIQISMKTVYGNDLVYPVNEAGRILATLIGKKTFSDEHMKLIHALGFTFELVNGYALKGNVI